MRLCDAILTCAFTVVSVGAIILGVRELPARSIHNSPLAEHKTLEDSPDLAPVPELEARVVLPTAWIKEFLASKSYEVSVQLTGDNLPLVSKFTNLERTMSNEHDLRSWTRYIVDHDREDPDIELEDEEEESVDLKIDEFILYLVENRGFKTEDLRFLHRQDLDYGYEQIEEELSIIYERERSAHNIEVWGEVLEASFSHVRTSFVITSVALVSGALIIAI